MVCVVKCNKELYLTIAKSLSSSHPFRATSKEPTEKDRPKLCLGSVFKDWKIFGAVKGSGKSVLEWS